MMQRALGLVMTSAVLILCGCTHDLNVKNLQAYATPLKLGGAGTKPDIAITPFNGTPEDLFFFNAIVERLAQDPGMGEVRTDYIPRLSARDDFHPDAILTIKPLVTYRSSGWNFLINWPGFLIFTPGWNGYIYRADVMTTFMLRDPDGTVLDEFEVPISYSIRHADMDRTIFTGLTWLEVSALAFFGGIYNANVFDRDVIPPLQVQVKDNYATYVLARAQARVRRAAAASSVRAAEAPAPESEAAPDASEASPPTEGEPQPDVSAPPPGESPGDPTPSEEVTPGSSDQAPETAPTESQGADPVQPSEEPDNPEP